MHFGFLYTLAMILVSTLANQIIFEQVGEMASSVTYLHVKFEVDIQDIEDHVHEYLGIFPKLHAYFKPMYESELKNTSTWESSWRRENIENTKNRYNELERALAHRERHANRFLDSIKALRSTLPKITVDNSTIKMKRSAEEEDKKKPIIQKISANVVQKLIETLVSGTNGQIQKSTFTRKAKKALASFVIKQGATGMLGVGLGALGTFMGLFNTFQIHSLKKELAEQREAHNRLVEVVQEQQDHLQLLDEAVSRIQTKIEFLRSSNAILLGNELGIIEEQIKERIERVTHAIQVAQTRRLAIDFLPVEYLPRLYEQLETQAKAINHKLLTKQQSDLFQLELSYFYDGTNMQLLLHVPTVPVDSILRLLKLHPFPLPLNKNYSVIPRAQDDLLAISSGFTRYSAQLSSVDLLGCHEINNVYLCERHGVLGKQLNDSCLGAMYLQDFDIVQELCTLQVTPAMEVVRQLQDNWFLVFSPAPQTAYISCRNGTNSETYFRGGITKTYLSPGCKMNLNSHLLQSDFSLQLPDEVVNFQWDWDISNIVETLEQDMEILREAGNVKPTLKDVRQLKITRTRTIFSRIFIISLMSLVALAIVALLVIWCFFRDLLFKIPCIKKKISRLRKRQPRKSKTPVVRNLLDTSTPSPDEMVYLRVPRWIQNRPTPPRPTPRLYPDIPNDLTPRLTFRNAPTENIPVVSAPLSELYAQRIHFQQMYANHFVRNQPIYAEIPISPVRRVIVHREM